MNLKKDDVIKFDDGAFRKVVEIIPHQDIKRAYYYKFDDGLVERDVRIHGEKVKTLSDEDVIKLIPDHDNIPENEQILFLSGFRAAEKFLKGG